MKKVIILISICCVVFIALFFGCDIKPPLLPVTEINENIEAGKKPDQRAYSGNITELILVSDDGLCKLEEFTIVRGISNLPCFNPSTTIIWPGAIIDGLSIVEGTYRPVIAGRSPLTISCSIQSTSESVSTTVAEPSLSSMRDALNSIVWDNRDAPIPAYIDWKFSSIYSLEHLRTELGINMEAGYSSIFGSVGASLESMYSWDSTETTTKLLIKFIQVYYSCDIDPPSKPADFFTEAVTWEDIENQISDGITPGYVSSIKYGRVALIAIESSESSLRVQEAFEAAFRLSFYGFTADGGTSLTTEQETIINSCRKNILILGGDSSTATPVLVDLVHLTDYLTSGLNANADTPVVPLSYQVNYMSDHSLMLLVLGAEGQIWTCGNEPVPTIEPTPEPTPGTIETRELSWTASGSIWYPGPNMVGDTITVELVGGGGGGGGNWEDDGHIGSGEGGRAGEWLKEQTITIDKYSAYIIRAGSGGSGGRNSRDNLGPGTPGTPGGNSSIGISGGAIIIEATGGDGGRGSSGYMNDYDCGGRSSGHPLGYGDGGDCACIQNQCTIGSPGNSGYVRITYSVYVE